MSTSLQSHALNAYINQPTTAKSYPNHRKNNNRQNNPSEGETNCYINPATETLANSQVTQQHPTSLVVSKLRVDGEFTGCTKDRTVRDTFVSELL